MREILFRGKMVDNGKWVYGYYHGGNGYSITKPCIYSVVKNDMPMTYEVLPETVGQYTGLTDKNGKKIFEGDICKDSRGWIFEVIWDRENGRFLGCETKQSGDTFICYVGRVPAVEIIGSIHDNPELLEV